MTSLRRDLWIFCAFISVYLGVTCVYKARGMEPSQVFPFFAWDLFIKVPGQVKELELLLREVDSRPFNPPRNLKDLWRPLKKNAPSNRFPFPDELGAAITKNDSEAEARVLNSIRGHFFVGARSYKISLVELEYDPLDFWRDRTKVKIRLIRDFNFSDEKVGGGVKP